MKKRLRVLVRWQQGEDEVWRTVRAPTVEEEDARQLQRELETLKKEQTSHVNRMSTHTAWGPPADLVPGNGA